MQSKIFVPYDEVHSGDGKYFPTMDHIPEEYVKLFDAKWEESRIVTKFTNILNKVAKNYIPRTEESVPRLLDVSDILSDTLETIRRTMWYLVHQYMLYNENRPEHILGEVRDDNTLTLQKIIDYYMIKLYHLLDEKEVKGARNGVSVFLRITPTCYPVTTYYDKYNECISYKVEFDIIDFKNKDREWCYVCNIQDQRFVDACRALHAAIGEHAHTNYYSDKSFFESSFSIFRKSSVVLDFFQSCFNYFRQYTNNLGRYHK